MTDVFTDTGLNVEKVIASLPEFPQDLLNFVDLIFPNKTSVTITRQSKI